MIVSLGNVTKRVNSTRLPVSLTDVTGQIVEPCDIINPTIKFYQRHNANYARIPDFGRYYWIDGWELIDGFWTAKMHVDVLATYRDDIGNTSRYVLRAAHDRDGSIMDRKYPMKTTLTRKSTGYTSGWSLTTYGGSYVVGVIATGGQWGSTAILSLDSTQFAQLRNALMTGNAYYQHIQDADLKNLAITMSNPMQYITFARYYPFSIPKGSATTVRLGMLDIPNMTFLPETALIWGPPAYTITLTPHPKAAIRGTYLNVEPYTRRYISFEPIGMLQIPGELVQGLSEVNLTMDIDVISGSGKAVLQTNAINSTILYRSNFIAGVDIPIAQLVTNNPLQLISGAVSLIGGVASAATGHYGGAVNSMVSAISDFAEGALPEVQAYKAGSGSLLQNEPEIKVSEFFQDIVDEDNSEFGRPLCQVRQLNTLAGYQLVRDGDIGIAGTAWEQEQIRSYLESGYFYE